MAKFKETIKSVTPEVRLSRITVNIPRENKQTIAFDMERVLLDEDDVLIGDPGYMDPISMKVDSIADAKITLARGSVITMAEALETLDIFFTQQYEKQTGEKSK